MTTSQKLFTPVAQLQLNRHLPQKRENGKIFVMQNCAIEDETIFFDRRVK